MTSNRGTAPPPRPGLRDAAARIRDGQAHAVVTDPPSLGTHRDASDPARRLIEDAGGTLIITARPGTR